MSDPPNAFLRSLAPLGLSTNERIVTLLWWHETFSTGAKVTAGTLCREVEEAGYPKQNATRVSRSLQDDRRVSKAPNGAFYLRVTAKESLDQSYLSYLSARPITITDSVLPHEMFVGTRGYIEKVVAKINASYDASLFDCCAVMCRRLLETLIIESYEANDIANDLKRENGHFKMFSGLLDCISKDTRFNLGRGAIGGLRTFKKLGDASAHNRRFNARKNDIDRVRDGMRIAAEELLHLSGLAK